MKKIILAMEAKVERSEDEVLNYAEQEWVREKGRKE